MRVDGGKTLNPGLLREKLILQEKVVSGQNSFGEDEYEWRDVLTFRAQVVAMQGREMEAMQQRFAEAKYKITAHYMPRVEWVHDRRLLWDDETLDVLDIGDPYGTRRVMVIVAREFVN